ncbi:MAG: hypothetical protein LBI33_12810 [Propionibacteriaceae bacterium]|jgi:hypothetical protein|nr:hypothetical protein [Propionibacteriaceae bacterium]
MLTPIQLDRVRRDLADIARLLPLAPLVVGTTPPGGRRGHGVPGPRPPVSLETLTLADWAPVPAPVDIDDVDADGDTPGRVLGAWSARFADLGVGGDRRPIPGRVAALVAAARLLADGLARFDAAAGAAEAEKLAWDMRVLAARLRRATGEQAPREGRCRNCGSPDVHADSATSNHVTCLACRWAGTAPHLVTLTVAADWYAAHDDGTTWCPTLRRLQAWAKDGTLHPHGGSRSDDGEPLYQLGVIHDIVAQRVTDGRRAKRQPVPDGPAHTSGDTPSPLITWTGDGA